jgi:hypothetical protein
VNGLSQEDWNGVHASADVRKHFYPIISEPQYIFEAEKIGEQIS